MGACGSKAAVTFPSPPNHASAPKGDKNMKIIFMIGRPGVGKGTMCGALRMRFQLVTFDVGQLILDEARCPAIAQPIPS